MKKKKVVIVDDELDLCHILTNYLNDLDYDVYAAHTLDTGMSIIKNIGPDVVFLDNNLPDGSGWDKVNDIAMQWPLCKINLISAYRSNPPDLHGMNAQILEKPLALGLIKTSLP